MKSSWQAIRLYAVFFSTILLFLSSADVAQASSSKTSSDRAAARPPQFVAMAFDGSLNTSFWEESLDFARDVGAKLTYFASGVYFTLDQNKNLYQFPGHAAGYSCIGFGGSSAAELRKRVDYVNRAYSEGNEIGSHANGHCPGPSHWTMDQWESEFKQFYGIFFNVFGFNKIGQAGNTFNFPQSEVVGFRAPFLEYNQTMYTVLQKYGYRYDTSQTAPTNYWPQKIAGGQWKFPLGQVVIAGTGKHTISMDYNFYFAQSNAKPDAANEALYEKQMYDTYMNYFQSNYTGNRAPVHIGHHFAKWNGGAYWNAMQHFARTVCRMPEVRCVTYSELADFMDRSAASGALANYASGNFPKFVDTRYAAQFPAIERGYDINLRLSQDLLDPHTIQAQFSGSDADQILARSELRWFVNDEPVVTSAGAETLTPQLPALARVKVALKVYRGDVEMLTATHFVDTGAQGEILAVSQDQVEDRALAGDMIEAHQDDHQGDQE